MESMDALIEPIKKFVRTLLRGVAKALNKLSGGKLSPDAITWTGLVTHVLIAYLITLREFNWAALLLVVFGLFDTLDGELARLQGKTKPSGLFLDSFSDRAKEILLYVGITYSIVDVGRPYMAVWAVAALGISMLITYVNAWGEVAATRAGHSVDVNKKFRAGLMGFEVRMFIILLGLLTGRLILASIVIAVLGMLTVYSRYEKVMKVLAEHD